MIRIDQRAPVSNAGPASSARRSSGAAFTLPTQGSATATRSSGVSAAGPLDTLLAVQAQEIRRIASAGRRGAGMTCSTGSTG